MVMIDWNYEHTRSQTNICWNDSTIARGNTKRLDTCDVLSLPVRLESEFSHHLLNSPTSSDLSESLGNFYTR